MKCFRLPNIRLKTDTGHWNLKATQIKLEVYVCATPKSSTLQSSSGKKNEIYGVNLCLTLAWQFEKKKKKKDTPLEKHLLTFSPV